MSTRTPSRPPAGVQTLLGGRRQTTGLQRRVELHPAKHNALARCATAALALGER
ncbi:hypothetical protein M8494_11115 [Serratia ureilytica]